MSQKKEILIYSAIGPLNMMYIDRYVVLMVPLWPFLFLIGMIHIFKRFVEFFGFLIIFLDSLQAFFGCLSPLCFLPILNETNYNYNKC